MIIEIIGVKSVNFKGNDNSDIQGMNIYYTAAGQPNVQGLEAGKLFVSNAKLRSLGLSKIEEGSYELFFNRYGKVDCLNKL